MIGVIGCGRMGLPICARLVSYGFTVTATDTRGDVRARVTETGALWSDSVAELVRRCAVVLSVLPGPGAVAALRDELLAVPSPGLTWIDMSTTTPAVSRENARQAAEHGVRALEAPMGGGPADARDGRLVLFVGGSAGDLASVRDLVDALAAQVVHVGEAGSGCLVKLLVNLLWFGQAVAGAEVLALAARAGMDPEVVRTAIQHSAAAGRFMERDARALIDGDDLTTFSLAGCLEELNSVLAVARRLDVPLALAERVTDLYTDALRHYGDIDGELLAARLVIERANVDFRPPAG